MLRNAGIQSKNMMRISWAYAQFEFIEYDSNSDLGLDTTESHLPKNYCSKLKTICSVLLEWFSSHNAQQTFFVEILFQ